MLGSGANNLENKEERKCLIYNKCNDSTYVLQASSSEGMGVSEGEESALVRLGFGGTSRPSLFVLHNKTP